ncbi:MAG TPA: DUF983 domain-containing protein [Tepidisphaeraceae bacterium]|jgi:uncharacterized protein (DUF983 family)
MPEDPAPDPSASDQPRLGSYLRRGFFCRCPECGISPVFVPFRKVRSLFDWFTPLDGCPRCGYAYQREDGYFLLAVWAINYGIVAGLGTLVGLYLQSRYNPGVFSPIWLWLLPMPLLSFLLARHAKSLFLAMDHYFDPHTARKSGQPDKRAPR